MDCRQETESDTIDIYWGTKVTKSLNFTSILYP